MKKSVATPPIGRNALARLHSVNPGSVDAWVKRGCPVRHDGKFELAAVEGWLRARDEKKASSADKKEQKLDAEIARIQKQCRQQDLEYSRATEEVHPKGACCASLAALVSDHLAPLLNIGARLATQFPELGKRLKDAAEAEIDAAFDTIRESFKK